MACRLFRFTFCLLLLTASAAYAGDAQKIGVVGSMKGTVTGTLEGDSTATPLKESDAIYLNETVRTGEDGAAQLMFLDKSSLTLTPSTEVKIDTFVYNPETAAGKMSVQGAKGAFRFIGGALSKNEPVIIKTPVSTIGIRGGIVQAGITDEGRKAEAIFLYGREMTVANAYGNATSITQFGHGVLISSAGGIQLMKPAEVNAQLHGFNNNTQSGASADQKTSNTGKTSAVGAQSVKTTSSSTTSSSSSGTSSGTSSSDTTSSSDSGTTSGTTTDSGTSTTSGSTTSTSSSTGSSITSATSAIPPANNYTSNVVSIPAVSDSSADNWGAWAQAINTDQTTYPSASLDTIISSVTSLPSQGSDLTKLPTSFGTVSYNGTANGSITSGASTAAATGFFSAGINFNTQQLTSLNINGFTNGLGYFGLSYSGGGTQQINNVPLSGVGTGTANLAVYGNAAEVLAGKFTATNGGTTAQGVLVGHQ